MTRIIRLCEGKAANDLQYLVLLASMKNHIPDGAAVIASGGLLNEAEFERRWGQYPSHLLTPCGIRNTVESSLGVQAAGLQKERALALKEKLDSLNSGKLQESLRGSFEE